VLNVHAIPTYRGEDVQATDTHIQIFHLKDHELQHKKVSEYLGAGCTCRRALIGTGLVEQILEAKGPSEDEAY